MLINVTKILTNDIAITNDKLKKNNFSSNVSLIHKNFHLMEGDCYALVWGIIHFL